MDEELFQKIEREYLLPRPSIGNPCLSSAQLPVDHKYSLHEVLSVPLSHLGSTMTMVRDHVTGEYCAAAEAELSAEVNPMSFLRATGRKQNYASGSSNQVPFQPGGLDEKDLASPSGNVPGFDPAEFCTVPDGFDRGLFVVADVTVPEQAQPIDLAVGRYGDLADEESSLEKEAGDGAKDSENDELDQLVSNDDSAEQTAEAIARAAKKDEAAKARKEWAHVIDVTAGFSNFHDLVPKPAKQFPFELDVFQKRAVYHLERGDSVFVAAHTSAGKTVVAEYAVALSQMHMTKTVYTSPIKALSNQKFHDFSESFGEDNVGILTGDVKIRPEAPCLIMTTEVLKNMLYRGADVLRDVEFVVFDECHYINDLERGVVWEEVIIMLPRHVSIILLSATVPNTKEFAEWVGRTKKRDIYVINTPKRPVPLEHYLYVGKNSVSSSEMMKVVDKNGNFNSNEWRDAYAAVNKPAGKTGGSSAGRGRSSAGRRGGGTGNLTRTVGRHTAERQGATLWVHLAGFLRKEKLLPAVVFTFSRKKCEEYASTLYNLDFLNESRRSEVHIFVDRCLKRLKPEDRTLPQVNVIRDLLKRGIGVHHSGLLPIIKEIVELLFARGLIHCLFATETFAMGVNMPARCVVFSSLRKHDGRSFRELLPGEYTQMAGRAGRRGLDDTGVVIINAANEVPDTPTLHTMLLGSATKLESQFRLTYNMILNLLRAKQLRVEEVIKRSFGENTLQGQVPEFERQVVDIKKKLDEIPELSCPICEEDIGEYYRIARAVQRLTTRLHSTVAHRSSGAGTSGYIAQAFCPGRLVVISEFPKLVLGIVHKPLASDGSKFACIILNDNEYGTKEHSNVPPRPLSDAQTQLAKLDQPRMTFTYAAVPTSSIALALDGVVKLSSSLVAKQRLNSTTPSSVPSDLELKISQTLQTLMAQPSVEYPWTKVRELEFQELVYERARLVQSAVGFQCMACPDLPSHFTMTHRRAELHAHLDELTIQLSDQNLDLLPDYRVRLEVLRDLGYIDETGNVQLKGRVACEMNSADELVLTELVLDNTLAQYEPEEIVALISAFVCPEKSENTDLMSRLPAQLKQGRQQVVETAKRIGSLQAAYGLPVSVEEYQREFRFGLMEVAYEWGRGMSFKNITTLTETQEGIIVRCILRIDDVLKNCMSAALLVGDAELKLKLQAASEMIRRDIVFAASLYF